MNLARTAPSSHHVSDLPNARSQELLHKHKRKTDAASAHVLDSRSDRSAGSAGVFHVACLEGTFEVLGRSHNAEPNEVTPLEYGHGTQNKEPLLPPSVVTHFTSLHDVAACGWR